MKTFQHFNSAGEAVCPVCGTSNDKETVLVPIAGTQEGGNCQAIQVHTECIEANWFYHKAQRFIGIGCLADPCLPIL